jgi:CRISPR-associated endonuclease Csn1
MTNFDTYLPDEKVLPKNSLLYQEFTIYNELIMSGWYGKNLDGKTVKNYFSPELRRQIVSDLFKHNKKVSVHKMLAYLNQTKSFNLTRNNEIFGIDTFVKSPSYNTSFSSYIDLIQVGISDKTIENHRDIFEQIIKWQTIFEDKEILKKTIENANENKWNNFLSDDQVSKLAKKHYTGWGRLSQKLLDRIKAENDKTIIENLKTENYRNFMRLLEDPKIAKAIKEAQIDEANTIKLTYGLVKDLAGSPALKKGIWQSLKIIQELEVYLGRENISKIVVEMPRENETDRVTTRQKQIENFYKKFNEKTGENVTPALNDEFKAQSQHQFDDEKVFLYFLQNGKSMYGCADLDLDKLSDYEVDHIVPQTYIKDDSFDNKVLVLKTENQTILDEDFSEIIEQYKLFQQKEKLTQNNSF